MIILNLVFALSAYGTAGANQEYFRCTKISCRPEAGCPGDLLEGAIVNPTIPYFITYVEGGAGFELTEDTLHVQGTGLTFDRQKDCTETKSLNREKIQVTFKCQKHPHSLRSVFIYDKSRRQGSYQGLMDDFEFGYIFSKCR